jgi:acetyltransferase-like isoleucine patch superfamily enzyme
MRAEPYLILPGTIAWLRGIWCKVWFPLTGRRFRAGRRLRVYGSLMILGPGRIEFGDDVLIIGNAIRGVCLRTLSRGAVIHLDRYAGLNGTSIQCIEQVEIGELSNIADAFISDTAAHVLGRNRRQLPVAAAEHAPVRIGRNVWISVQCVVLHGASIGDDTVIGACSLVRKDVPSGVFAVGNPLRIVQPLPDE